MKKLNPKLVGLIWFSIVLIFIASMLSISYFLTAYVYAVANLHPSALVIQIVNSLLGLFLAGVIVGGVSRFARSRGWAPEMSLFGPIIEAMQRIAKGDYSVQVQHSRHENQPVSELVKTMNDMAQELNAMEKMRQEFISNVSHEIQSPLTSIRGFAQALENDQLTSEERHRYLSIIENESTRLSRITENLLKLASLESDQVKFEPKAYCLDKQIRNLILACEPQWAGKHIEMEVALEEVQIVADEDLLSQVWINLISNSIKFTPDGGSIQIGLCRQDDRIEFKITDTGSGISVEDQARVFERFFKADKSRTYSNGGSGLGLSIVKKIVELHLGQIDLESQPGQGTTFTVSLPREQP